MVVKFVNSVFDSDDVLYITIVETSSHLKKIKIVATFKNVKSDQNLSKITWNFDTLELAKELLDGYYDTILKNANLIKTI